MRARFSSRALGARVLGIVPLGLLLASSCSLVYDLSQDQCGKHDDCAHFGLNYYCEDGLCKSPDGAGGTRGGTSGSGGTEPTGGTSATGGTDPTGGTSGDGSGGSTGGTGGGGKGGSGASGGTGGGGTSGDAGAGGGPVEPECELHNDCYELYDDSDINPRACVEGQCIPLKTDKCPVLLPLKDMTYNALRSGTSAATNAIVLGAFSSIPSNLVNNIIRNYDLAVNEFRVTGNGLPAGGSRRRHVVMVVCDYRVQETQNELLVPAGHLIDDLKVPAIVAAMPPADQEYVFREKAFDADVFMMTPSFSDDPLIKLDDDDLIWHMLGGSDALSVTYPPLIDQIITHLTNVGSLAVGEDARIAVLNANDQRLLDELATFVRERIRWNDGKTAVENSPASFRSIEVVSEYTNPSAPQAAVAESLLDFAPHIVIAMTAQEGPRTIAPLVEASWDARNPGQARPFYVMSPLVFGTAQVVDLVTNHPDVRQRLLGLNWPAAEDPTNYNAYTARFDEAYMEVAGTRNYENFYDAAYYTVYGVAAAGSLLTGSRIAEGMLRITTGTTEYNVGTADMREALSTLQVDSENRIRLIGTMGPPTWSSDGARNDPGTVWCMNADGNFAPDKLRLDEEGALEGTDFCFPFPAPAP